jgi:hypothetical protein
MKLKSWQKTIQMLNLFLARPNKTQLLKKSKINCFKIKIMK